MKKFLQNSHLNGMMNNIKKSFMQFLNSKITKVTILSVAGFLAGVLITSAGIYSFNQSKLHSSVGGLEIPVSPEITENLETLFENEEESSEIAGSSETADESLADNSYSPVTYQTYRVKKGDMIGFIADEFDVTQDTIISVNNIKQSRLIQVGQ